MTKPHEETWDIDDVSVHLPGSIAQLAAREKLAAAAPRMVRALMDMHATIDCACIRLRASPCVLVVELQNAGVL